MARCDRLRGVEGFFDLLTLMMSFPRNSVATETVEAYIDVLTSIDPATLAHELCHLLQATTTAVGLAEFGLALDLSALDLSAVGARTRSPGWTGVIDAPIVRIDQRPAPDDPASRSRWGLRLRSVYRGGLTLPAPHLPASSNPAGAPGLRARLSVLSPGAILFGESTRLPLVFSIPTESPNPDVDGVLLGSAHLRESHAKVFEQATRARLGLAGDKGAPPGRMSLHDPRSAVGHDPYFAAHWLYGSTVFLSEHPEYGSAEEFCAIAELALMVDPVVTPAAFRAVFGLASSSEVGETFGGHFNPFTTFAVLVNVFSQLAHPRRAAMDREPWEQLRELQDRLLREVGYDGDMETLLRRCDQFAEHLCENFSGHPFVGPVLAESYLDIQRQASELRCTSTVQGHLLSLLEIPFPELVKMIAPLAPAIGVGDAIVCDGNSQHAHAGAAWLRLRMLADTTGSIVAGNRVCPLAAPVRTCSRPEVELCHGLPSNFEVVDYCTRSSAVAALRRWGVREVRWMPPASL